MLSDSFRLDMLIKPYHLSAIKNEKIRGVYVLLSHKEPLYVGKSEYLRKRLISHLTGNSANTREMMCRVDEIGIKICETPSEMDWVETALINDYNPPYNTVRNVYTLKRHIMSKHTRFCKGKNITGSHCRFYAHHNGYCRRHGGNGITKEILTEKELNNLLSDNQIKLVI